MRQLFFSLPYIDINTSASSAVLPKHFQFFRAALMYISKLQIQIGEYNFWINTRVNDWVLAVNFYHSLHKYN